MNPPEGLEARDRAKLERLALAEWPPPADVQIDSVVIDGGFAAVNLLLNGDYEYCAIFQRDSGGHWWESSSSSGHMDVSDLTRIDPRRP